MTNEEIDRVQTATFNEVEWQPLIEFFWNRYNSRYFNQIEYLQNSPNRLIRNNCGFIIATIDCILIETLEQYYSGSDETIGKNHDPFYTFFNRSKDFQNLNMNNGDAGLFAGLIRSGLIHQSKTKKLSIINKQKGTPLLDWIDSNDKSKGFKLNRDKFHEVVKYEYFILIESLKKIENSDLRTKFKIKLKTIT